MSFSGLADRARFMTHNVIDVFGPKVRFQLRDLDDIGFDHSDSAGHDGWYIFRSVGRGAPVYSGLYPVGSCEANVS